MSFMKATGKALADVIPGLGKFTYDTKVGTVFITSGSGVVGYRVATSLLEAGHKDVHTAVIGAWSKGEGPRPRQGGGNGGKKRETESKFESKRRKE